MKALLWLAWEHEFFHARVDAFSLLQEAASIRPTYRRYHCRVYQPTKGQHGALEEALANYVARQSLEKRLRDLQSLGAWQDGAVTATMAFVDEVFSASPPGYSDWANGADPLNWRLLAAQVLTGKVDPGLGAIPPVEGLLHDLPGVALKPGDVPVFVTRVTELGRSLFSTPPRKEVVRVLRHMGFVHDPSGGKGSHEKWRRPDGAGFWILPSGDSLSPGVFKTLLHVLGVDKRTYMQLRTQV